MIIAFLDGQPVRQFEGRARCGRRSAESAIAEAESVILASLSSLPLKKKSHLHQGNRTESTSQS